MAAQLGSLQRDEHPRELSNCRSRSQKYGISQSHSPIPPFPSHLPVLVVDSGGGGLSTCEAVGARDWRME